MRGARYYRPDVPTRLLKCSEKLLRNCDGETEQCCKVVPCEYCLTFTTEDYPVEYGIASGSTTWAGEVADAAFYAYWEKLEGICYFVVRLNGVEVSRSNCTQTECRDSSATAEVVIGGKAGVLRWEKRLHHPLQYVTDQNTNCQTHFCGDCECTCETLCVVVTEPPPDPAYPEAPDVRLDPYSCDGLLPMDCGFCDAVPDENTTYGELPNTEEDACKRPVWQNTVAERFITVFLSRAEYTGECLLNGVVDGEHFGPEAVSDCKNITASWTKADGTKIDVSCKQCGCDTGTPPDAGACCDLIPCAFCVQYEVYGEEPIRVYIEYGSGQWYGSIGGVTVLMYWYVNAYGECAFVVEYGGEVVYEKTIAEGQSCENPTDFVELPYGTLSWTIHPLSPMKRQDENTPFCGVCDCTSECICITVTDPPDRVGGARAYNGEVCVDDYDECDDPLWAGNVGGREIEITLLPDRVTNQCVLVIDVDGEVFDLDVFLCDDMSFSVELYDGTIVTGASKKCECEEPPRICPDCQNNFPSTVNVLIPSLEVADTATLSSSGNDDFLYVWEGSDGAYSWQADFACKNINFVIAASGSSYRCTADNGPPTTVTIELVSCYPDPLQIVYTFNCIEGGSLTVVLME